MKCGGGAALRKLRPVGVDMVKMGALRLCTEASLVEPEAADCCSAPRTGAITKRKGTVLFIRALIKRKEINKIRASNGTRIIEVRAG